MNESTGCVAETATYYDAAAVASKGKSTGGARYMQSNCSGCSGIVIDQMSVKYSE